MHTKQLTTMHTKQLTTIHTRQLKTIHTRQLTTMQTGHLKIQHVPKVNNEMLLVALIRRPIIFSPPISEKKSLNIGTYTVFEHFIFNYGNDNSHCYPDSFPPSPTQNWVICHIAGWAFLFPVDISQCPVMSRQFPPCDRLYICCRQYFSTAVISCRSVTYKPNQRSFCIYEITLHVNLLFERFSVSYFGTGFECKYLAFPSVNIMPSVVHINLLFGER